MILEDICKLVEEQRNTLKEYIRHQISSILENSSNSLKCYTPFGVETKFELPAIIKVIKHNSNIYFILDNGTQISFDDDVFDLNHLVTILKSLKP